MKFAVKKEKCIVLLGSDSGESYPVNSRVEYLQWQRTV